MKSNTLFILIVLDIVRLSIFFLFVLLSLKCFLSYVARAFPICLKDYKCYILFYLACFFRYSLLLCYNKLLNNNLHITWSVIATTINKFAFLTILFHNNDLLFIIISFLFCIFSCLFVPCKRLQSWIDMHTIMKVCFLFQFLSIFF